MTGATLSIVVPVLNEADEIEAALVALANFRARGVEVIVVDGGSRDETARLAGPLADRVIAGPRGRALQMNAGAAVACGDTLLFLHADTRLPDDADVLLSGGLAQTGRIWGRFDVRIDDGPVLRLVAGMMNLRSRISGVATGDQAIFVTRAAFDRVGGYPPISLMEDIALSARLKPLGPPLCLRAKARTSSRRWRRYGIMRTVFLMWRLRLAYFAGADPAHLAQRYGYIPAEQ
ncbi:MAG TPA: TIGR04283 family arsenosugar biosynthesis glycosyltransferase [Pseudolabrys sp.]|nr:TIGR04283 family arsenosugar biosynthesis glycosyltransferase [Pseudolabrys sp.]